MIDRLWNVDSGLLKRPAEFVGCDVCGAILFIGQREMDLRHLFGALRFVFVPSVSDA